VPPALAPNGQPLASFGDRFLAFLIDAAVMTGVALLLLIPTTILMFAVIMPSALGVGPDGSYAEPNVFAFVLPMLALQFGLVIMLLAVYYVYFVEMMFRTGQTLGKRVMKLRIIPLDPRLSLDRGIATRRYLVQYLAGSFVPFLNYLDGLWQLWDKPYQQCLHDKFAQTVVVKVPG
jgi:uncharacterized RDD family membrane protein YckC